MNEQSKLSYNDDGKLHSFDDEPAVILLDSKTWFCDGFIHRDNAPAIVRVPNKHDLPLCEWWYQGTKYTFDEYCKKFNIPLERAIELKMQYDVKEDIPLLNHES